MSTGSTTNTTQQSLDGEQADKRQAQEALKGVSAILWEVGRRDDLDDTEAQLRETARIAEERGVIGGER